MTWPGGYIEMASTCNHRIFRPGLIASIRASRPDWLQSAELRRRVNAGLNKGEARNALARAVFFNRLGEIRDRSFEQQRYRASGLNLVTAAIVLWNTVYLELSANALREQGSLR
ncbi:Tn3 family transposase, partial [Pseudomonas savastanoi pv. glycinea]